MGMYRPLTLVALLFVGLATGQQVERRGEAEAETARFSELQDESSRLLKNEEELLLLILDMEAQIDRLSGSKDEG